jgi:hypothetical protein
MTPEFSSRMKRLDARLKDWYSMPRERLREFLGRLPWQRSEILQDFEYFIETLRHAAWCYALQTQKIRAETTDPHVHFEASFALAFDPLRDPVEGEAELRAMRAAAWQGIMRKAAEKQQREAGNGN